MNLAYVELSMPEIAKYRLRQEMQKVVASTDYYYSPEITRIAGDVINKLHLTLFFGLHEFEVNNIQLIDYLWEARISSIQVSGLELFKGYQNQYQILVAKVLPDEKLVKAYEYIRDNCRWEEENVNSQFKPHLTLAYVKPDYVLPDYEQFNVYIEAGTPMVKVHKER